MQLMFVPSDVEADNLLQVSNLIVAGRLTAKVDTVGSIIETSMMDPKNVNYQALMKQGDSLLNRIQKLSKAIDLE
jgi:26S proteasome regulatory subunit N7